jgi:hypothetical protein
MRLSSKVSLEPFVNIVTERLPALRVLAKKLILTCQVPRVLRLQSKNRTRQQTSLAKPLRAVRLSDIHPLKNVVVCFHEAFFLLSICSTNLKNRHFSITYQTSFRIYRRLIPRVFGLGIINFKRGCSQPTRCSTRTCRRSSSNLLRIVTSKVRYIWARAATNFIQNTLYDDPTQIIQRQRTATP